MKLASCDFGEATQQTAGKDVVSPELEAAATLAAAVA